jgi:transcriptional regulator with XRE-family HTH domain
MLPKSQLTPEERFGAALRNVMRGYGLIDVAKATGVSYGMLRQVVNGHRPPTYAMLLRLVRMFPALLDAVRESAEEVVLYHL